MRAKVILRSLLNAITDYLRDCKVTLPITQTERAFMDELIYYNIDVEEDTIDGTAIKKAICLSSSTNSYRAPITTHCKTSAGEITSSFTVDRSVNIIRVCTRTCP